MKKLILPLVFFILSACYYDSEEALFGKPGACNTTNVKYSTSISPILSAYCTGCHNPSGDNGGILLTNYKEVKIYADNGQLKSSIEHTAGTPMPKNGGFLSSCDISIINVWITNKAPEN